MPSESWFSYFKDLLNPQVNSVTSDFTECVFKFITIHDSVECIDCNNSSILSDPITHSEIRKANNSLKSGKAPVPDGIPSKFFKRGL